MKELTCEMCGSTDLIKDDGVFVCQKCKTKYSVEEAKKMLAEGVAEVAVPVRIDNSANFEKSLKNARRAKDDSNYELAEKYYEEVIDADPDNWEAVFFNTYFKSMQCKIAEIQSAAIAVNNCLNTVLTLIKNHVSEEAEQDKAINEVASHTIAISTTLYNSAKSHYDGINSSIQYKYTQEYINRVVATYNTMYYLGDQLEEIFSDKQLASIYAVTAWKTGISWHNSIMILFAEPGINKRTITSYADKIKKYDTSYEVPEIRRSKSGCYVATAIYGSYDCPQVWTLRRYRDNTLSSAWHGRAFIRMYYTISPTIIKIFGKTAWFNRIFKNMLDFMTSKLNANGVADTPYYDKL